MKINFKMTWAFLSLQEKACLRTHDSSHESKSTIHYLGRTLRTPSRVLLRTFDAHPAAADPLPQVSGLERLRDWLPEHGAAVDGGEPEGELQHNISSFQTITFVFSEYHHNKGPSVLHIFDS